MSLPEPPIRQVGLRRFALILGIGLLALAGGGLVAAGIGPTGHPRSLAVPGLPPVLASPHHARRRRSV
jgi:hypothetical protein